MFKAHRRLFHLQKDNFGQKNHQKTCIGPKEATVAYNKLKAYS